MKNLIYILIPFLISCKSLVSVSSPLTEKAPDLELGAHIDGALIVGASKNADEFTLASTAHGIITARTENFYVSNVKFYNFGADMAALGSCSHCFHPASTDSGGRTTTFKNLQFTDVI